MCGLAKDPDKNQTVKSPMEASYPELPVVSVTCVLSAKTVAYCIAVGVHSLTTKKFVAMKVSNIYKKYMEQFEAMNDAEQTRKECLEWYENLSALLLDCYYSNVLPVKISGGCGGRNLDS